MQLEHGGRQTFDFSPSPSTPLPFHIVSQGHGTGGGLVLVGLGFGHLGGSGFDKQTTLPQDSLLLNVQRSLHPSKTPECLHPVIY